MIINHFTRACAVLLAGAASLCHAQILTTLANFNTPYGVAPNALIQATDGNYYGTTGVGGGNNGGTVFAISPLNTLTTLTNFNGADGSAPFAGLTLGNNGKLYGTTNTGGAAGLGTVYTLTPLGPLVLHSFIGIDGSTPYASLVQGSDGNFYGTTSQGGTGGLGTVFKISPFGVVTTLHNFIGIDGANPHGALIQSLGGDFYGTTYAGGLFGAGTVFKISTLGVLTTLHSFTGLDGQNPNSALVQAGNTNLYGTTFSGGPAGAGTVFQITSLGFLTTLHSFGYPGNLSHGLTRVTNGDFYGVCDNCGNYGSIFRIPALGGFQTVLDFDGINGCHPQSTMIQATNGSLYGTTLSCGAYGGGTAFSLNVGLRSFVETLPTAGLVGQVIRILGNDLIGSTSVSFGGTLASFTVISNSQIVATVPFGAISGSVIVTRPIGTLYSNSPFFVAP